MSNLCFDFPDELIKTHILDQTGKSREFKVKNECPECKSKLVIWGTGAFVDDDGTTQEIDLITCEKHCYVDIKKLREYNGL